MIFVPIIWQIWKNLGFGWVCFHAKLGATNNHGNGMNDIFYKALSDVIGTTSKFLKKKSWCREKPFGNFCFLVLIKKLPKNGIFLTFFRVSSHFFLQKLISNWLILLWLSIIPNFQVFVEIFFFNLRGKNAEILI